MLEELVEPVEIEVECVGGETVGLRLGHDELPRVVAVGNEAAPQNRNERLNRSRDVVRRPAIPDQLGDPVNRDVMAPCSEQGLE